jgi:DnaJ-class molecular chaperone
MTATKPKTRLVSCQDCDPCIGGRPDQCAVGAWDDVSICPNCGGSGKKPVGAVCSLCHGTGEVNL